MAKQDWNYIYQHWLKHALECGYSSDLFIDIIFELPQMPSRENEYRWWPSSNIDAAKRKCLEFWNEHPVSYGRTDVLQLDKGVQRTIEFLWFHRDSIEHQAATLIAAFLFPYCQSMRTRPIPEGFNCSYSELVKLYRLAHAKAFESDDLFEWHHSCTTVLPEFPQLTNIRFDDLEGLLAYIAERNVLMLNVYQPVNIKFLTSVS